MLDTGADQTILDGSLAFQWGWRQEDLAQRADETRFISGIQAHGTQVAAYRHHLEFLIPLGPRFVSLRLAVYLCTPNTISTPVLGRQDFMQLVDVAVSEADQQFYLRFRDRSVLQRAW